MPQTIRNIRHHDAAAGFRDGRFHTVGSCGCSSCCGLRPSRSGHMDDAAVRRAVSAGVARVMAPVTVSSKRTARDAVIRRMGELSESLDALAPKIHAFKERRRKMHDAAARQAAEGSGLVSATAGYVRDDAGNRVRSMTSADMNAIHAAHYGRT